MLSTEEEIKALELRIAVLKKEKIGTADKALIKELEHQDFFQRCRSLPKIWFNRLLGNKQNSSIKYIGDKFNLPLDGKTIDLIEVLPVFYDQILELRKFKDKNSNDEMGSLKNRIAQEEFEKLTNQTQLTRIELQERINHLVPRSMVREKLRWLAGQLQALGKRLYRSKDGTEAQTTLNEFLETLATECDTGGSLHI